MQLEEIKADTRLVGVMPDGPVSVIAAIWHGTGALELTFKRMDGTLAQRVLYRSDEQNLEAAASAARPFDADAADFKLAAEAQRIKLAGLYDPMLAVATSDVQPLPHQIRAVYGELLPRTPLRFLLADDPGAGKTIMAGVYIKELLLRDDVKRCLIVAPGGLVEQWQDELFFKFGLRFEILTNQMLDTSLAVPVFDGHPLLIARMDHLSRNDELIRQLDEADPWDLVVVDEAHRMGAHYYGTKLTKTKRYELGELLGQHTRHLLLMTATPHAGKDEDFHLFMGLLDADRFAGKFGKGISDSDVSGLMRRMVKEDLLTFEGRRLFPERIAQTVPYQLTDAEKDLYDQVTDYVREGMNRADKLDGKRRNTVGFALTVLQRRLASSPEAIWMSLQRRANRLEQRKADILAGRIGADEVPDVDVLDDPDEYTAEETEHIEEELLDAATAARTVEELNAELAELKALIAVAAAVRASGKDRKWQELSKIVQDEMLTADGKPRKLIIFTEHRDTLNYLTGRIRSLLGKPEAVKAIHGGVRRAERREITEEFTKNPACRILLATDAAGEGLNLQAAHLMVNYDLPWNPNRIEQRFGRIHRIGQTEVCRLWNLVASNTREGLVYERLLDKVEEQRKAYGGKVFDVLGAAFSETPLRDLLIQAIRYGESEETKMRMFAVIDGEYANGVKELLAERALANEHLSDTDLAAMRAQMDEARARRLQPHYIEWAFRNAFTRLGGRLARREKGRFEISNVPAAIRHQPRGPIATRYERVTFDLSGIDVDGKPRADLLAPGHPLHDAVADETITRLSGTLDRGTVLVSATIEAPQLLVGVEEEIVDGTGTKVARRFGYAYVDQSGTVTPAGPAPYLDCVAAPAGPAVEAAKAAPWLADAEAKAVSWIIANQLPGYVAEVQPRRAAEIKRARKQIIQRLQHEMNRLAGEAMVAAQIEKAGGRAKESPESLARKAQDFETRLERRRILLDAQAQMSPAPPRLLTSALVLPLSAVSDEIPDEAPIRAVATKEVERRGVEAVLAAERALGRKPVEQPFNNPGFDILSHVGGGDPIRIEVKARIDGADSFFVTHNEVLTAKNAQPRYRLALVRVHPDGPDHDEVRYLADPFPGTELGGFDSEGITGNWPKTWAKASPPF